MTALLGWAKKELYFSFVTQGAIGPDHEDSPRPNANERSWLLQNGADVTNDLAAFCAPIWRKLQLAPLKLPHLLGKVHTLELRGFELAWLMMSNCNFDCWNVPRWLLTKLAFLSQRYRRGQSLPRRFCCLLRRWRTWRSWSRRWWAWCGGTARSRCSWPPSGCRGPSPSTSKIRWAPMHVTWDLESRRHQSCKRSWKIWSRSKIKIIAGDLDQNSKRSKITTIDLDQCKIKDQDHDLDLWSWSCYYFNKKIKDQDQLSWSLILILIFYT